MIDDSQYYRINEVPVRELFNKEFIDLFLKNGKLIGLSINAISNQDNHLAFIPNGKLILTLSKDAFQKVGIEKTRSCKNSNGLCKCILYLKI